MGDGGPLLQTCRQSAIANTTLAGICRVGHWCGYGALALDRARGSRGEFERGVSGDMIAGRGTDGPTATAQSETEAGIPSRVAGLFAFQTTEDT